MIKTSLRKNTKMTEKIHPTRHSEALLDIETLGVERARDHLNVADNLRALINDSSDDSDRAIADLITETNTASSATVEDVVIADEVGLGHLLEDERDDDDTVVALSRQTSEPLAQALREVGDYWGDDALKTVLTKLDAVADEHIHRDDRPRTIEQLHSDYENQTRHALSDVVTMNGHVEYVAHDSIVAAPGDRMHAAMAESTRTKEARKILGIPSEFKHFQLVESSERAQREDMETSARGDRNGFTEGRKMWQERTFGSSEIEPLRNELMERFARHVGLRVGHEIIDDTSGEVKRPIMDITLNAHAEVEVKRAIAERGVALTRALAALNELAENHEEKSSDECAQLLIEMGVWSRGHGKLLDGDCPAGTIADLYIDNTDLEKYEQIDALVARISGNTIDSQARLAEGIVNMAAYTFPSGVELMHATPVGSLNHIVERGAVAPRSQVMHGVHRKTQLNGGFIHMTAPGSTAYEYTSSGQKVVFGIPIDVIMEHSPYIQLEHAYMENIIARPNKDTGSTDWHSMQYELGKLQINNIHTAPMAFQAALQTMHANLDKGLRHSYLKNGLYNNYSFAATDQVETAAAYTYPLEELSVYTNSFEPIKKAAESYPTKQDTLFDVAHVAVADLEHQIVYPDGNVKGSGRLLSEIKLPTFDINNEAGVTIFAPISSREVAFSEAEVGNSFYQSQLDISLGTIKPHKVAKFAGELLEGGMAADVVLAESLKSINERGGRASEFIGSYSENRAAFAAAGISIEDIVQGLRPEKLEEINLDSRVSLSLDDADREALAKVYGDRMYLLSPDDFALKASALEASGYIFSESQRAYISAFEERQAELENKPIELPDFNLHF